MPLLRAIVLLGILVTACTAPSADVQDILRVTRVEVDPANANLQIGSSFQFTATARTGSGIIVSNRPVHWTSNAPDRVSVSANGLVTAVRIGGPVQITATVDDVPGSAIVTVSPEPITRITITPQETTLPMGGTAQFSASATDGGGQLVLGAVYSWQSSDPSIVDVSTSGRVFALVPGGPVTITATNGTVSGTATVTVTQIASRLGFTQQPSGATAGQPVSPAVRVTILDPAGNPVASSTAPVTLRLGNNPGGASLAGTLTVDASSGVATWTDLRLDRPGNGYTLIASAAGLIEATSVPFDVVPVSLTIVTQPSSVAVSGQSLAQQPVIQVRNGGGTPLPGIPVTASIGSGGGTLGGTATVTSNSSGLATFTNLAITGSTGSRVLRFDAPGATAVSSTSILVSALHLAFVQQPTTGTTGRPLSPAIRIAIQDPNGTTVNTSSAAITLALGNNPSGATLGGTLTVNAVNGIATYSDLVVDRTGTGYTLAASSSGLTGTTSAPFNVAGISVTISIQPSAVATSGVPFSQQPVITVRDGANSPLSGIAVTASIASGGGTLSGTMTVTTNGNGIVNFTDLSIAGPAGTRILQFDAPAATAVISNPIAVVTVPTAMVITRQPPSGTAGQPLSPSVQVALRDQYGSTVTGATNPVSVRLGNNPGGATLTGTLTVNPANGVATFANLVLDRAGTGYTLIASSPGLADVISSGFTIGLVTLTITTQPSATSISGQPLTQQPVITVRDAANQPLSGVPVTATIGSGGGVLSGTLTVSSNASGVASFTNLAISGSAGSRTLSFSTPGATTVTSTPIVVTAAPPTQMSFTQQPSNGTVGQPLSPPVQVAVQDATGATVTGFSGGVSIQLGNNPGSATLGGTLTVNAVNGVATFGNLTINQTGTGFTLIASSTGLPNKSSAGFNVGPVSLSITTQPSATSVSGQPLTQQPVITVRDAANQPLSGVSVTATIGSGGGVLSGTLTVNSNASGVASFTNLAISGSAGSRTLSFNAPGAAPVSSTPIVVTPAPAQMAFTQQPSNGTVGQPLSPPVQVAVQDATGATVTGFSGAVSIQLGNNPGSATLSGTLTVNAVNGVATFSNLGLNQTGTGFTLIASSTGLPNKTSAGFNVGPVSLSITTQPSGSVQSGQVFPQQPVILVRNAANTPLSGVIVTASIASGGGTLGGTATATSNQSGVAAFTNLSITGAPGTRTLGFAAPGATAITSAPISVISPPATQLTITVQPSSTAGRDVVFVQQPVIQLRDANGNPVSQSGVPVTAALASGPGTALLKGTTTVNTNGSGVATFTNLKIDRQGTYTIQFSSGSLQSVISGSITIP